MPSADDIQQALANASSAGDEEAADYYRAQLAAQQSAPGTPEAYAGSSRVQSPAPSDDDLRSAMVRARAAKDPEAVKYFWGQLGEAQKRNLATARQKVVEQLGPSGRFLAGIGQGMTNVGMNVADVAGSTPLTQGLKPSPETWQAFQETSQPLLQTTGGKTGAMVGETAATLPLGYGTAAAASKVPFLAARPALNLALQGAGQGALLAGPDDRLRGAVAGAGLGYGLAKTGQGLSRLWTGASGTAPSAAAQYLESQGVKNLTMGQQSPYSRIAQLEEATTSKNPELQEMRMAPRRQWEDVVMSKTLPAGATLPSGDSPAAKMAAIEDLFDRAYGTIKGEKVYPAVWQNGQGVPLQGTKNTSGAFDLAVQDQSVPADAATRDKWGKWLQNQLTILPGRQGAIGQVDASDLITIRSNIRQQMRRVMSGANPDHESFGLLRNAEQAVTSTLESQLSPGTAAALKDTDRAYREFMTINPVVERSADAPGGFTPARLAQAVANRPPDDPLRRLASAGRETFDMRVPPTGARLITRGAELSPFGVPVGPMVSDAAVQLANTPLGSALLRGQTVAQIRAKMAADWVRQRIADKALQAGTANIAGRISRPALAPPLLQADEDVNNEGREPGGEKSPTGVQPSAPSSPPSNGGNRAPGIDTTSHGALSEEHIDPAQALAAAAQSSPQSLGPYAAPVAARLKLGGPKGLAQYHFLQSQKDPQFRKMVEQLTGEERAQ